MGLFTKLFGSYSDRELKRIMPIARAVEDREAQFAALTDEQLRGKTGELKQRLENGETLDDILPDAFAAAREAAWRVLGMKPFPVQIIGGIVLHQGRIAEMKTGEGKTLVAVLPAYLNARWRARASTSSRSTTIWPAVTASGWARYTASLAFPSASSCTA